MKKLLLVGALALSGFSALNAQEFRFGPKAGYSLSMLKAETDGMKMNLDPKSSFYAGGFVEYKFSDKVGIMAEVLYSQLGGKQDETFTTVINGAVVTASAKTEYTFGTVQIPVGAKYFATENFALALGLNVGIIATAEGEFDVSGSVSDGSGQNVSGSQAGKVDIKDEINSLNLAPFIGAEYTLENGLFFDARYNLGVSNLSKTSNETVKNSFVQVGIGFKFGGN
ncbi:hypothetical protein ASG01_01280 [Chryseobacterium sp. Leaf180]|jgi:opacity protein-like surface antigen|uniref:porin family protein n=1 Tax=Chryseobacterium sp. Leaf180 TaxID=1736289 RepID=UPI0006F2BDD1|nr:porin family protein [Chryseobacterium sp. Leaf180]KQR94545.1 hypothetical protein ASG01_01280 [Chryseobacterium sp. Leaf180]